MTIKVVIADDHEVVRKGLVEIFQGSGIEILDQACNGQEAYEKTVAVKPDVLLLDVRMPDADGIQALSRLKAESHKTQVVVLSTYDSPTYVARAVALGAKDYVLKNASPDELIQVVRRVAGGGEPGPESLFMRVQSMMSTRENQREGVQLTNR
ncbi:MAG: response regulator transcription factor, partial [Planctomycetota bacterium]|nr:response regulator transcription factor [Planctomycetota bacterium]